MTLSLAFGFSQGGAEVAVTAELVRLDLGTGAAVAVPSLRAEARFDLSALAMPNVAIDTLAIGFGLDAGRRPVLVVALENAVVFGTTHARLDLTNPDAVAAAAASAATDALAEVLGNLGPAGDLIGVALGWEAPAGAGAGYPRLDLIAFLGDPLGRLRAHWEDVLANHAADVDAVLAQLRALITGDATPGAVTGGGTDADPWLLPLVAGLHVAVWRGADGRLYLGVGFLRSVDTLGERCTVIETRVRAAVVALDLAGGGASFLPEVSVRALGRARGGGRLVTDQGAVRFEVDHLGVTALWTPDGGLDIRPSAPNPAVLFDNVKLPLPIPDLSLPFEDMLASLGDRQWEALERLAAVAADKLQARWLDDLVEALGWRPSAPMLGGPTRHRLALSALVDDAGKAIREWLADLLADAEAEVERRLQPLARFLSGRPNASFAVEGRGTITDPWRIDLLPGSGLPALAAWREPDAPLPVPQALRSIGLRSWRPGDVGLAPGELAEAILSELPDVGGPFGAGITAEALNQGLLAVAGLWQGTDGLVPPPAAAPAGTVLHLVENRSAAGLNSGAGPRCDPGGRAGDGGSGRGAGRRIAARRRARPRARARHARGRTRPGGLHAPGDRAGNLARAARPARRREAGQRRSGRPARAGGAAEDGVAGCDRRHGRRRRGRWPRGLAGAARDGKRQRPARDGRSAAGHAAGADRARGRGGRDAAAAGRVPSRSRPGRTGRRRPRHGAAAAVDAAGRGGA